MRSDHLKLCLLALTLCVVASDDEEAAVFVAMLDQGTPPPAAPSTPTASKAPVEPAMEDVSAQRPDLQIACAVLAEGDLNRGLTQECLDALDARFLPLPVSPTVLPVSPPLTWRDVFGDMVRDIAPNIEVVDAALADEVCAVPEGGIRPELAARCGARAMAELHVLRDACNHLSHFSPHFSLSRKGFDLGSLRLAGWSRLESTPYRRNINGAVRDQVLARWSEEAPDQEAYVEGAQRLDDLYYRTMWKRARCVASKGVLDWMRGERWDGLLARAARLGDDFALAHHSGDRRHAARLMEFNPPLAFLQLASLDIQNVRGAWDQEDSTAGWRIVEEGLEDRIRLLKMAGIDCGAPCTAKAVDALQHRLRRHLSECSAQKCANLAEMRNLQADLQRPYEELYLSRRARSLPHRKRAEAVAVKYVLAVESLTQATGVEVNRALLRRMADPDDPELLIADEVEQARFEAARLVAGLRQGRR